MTLPAQELVDRLVGHLAHDVPAGKLDGGEGRTMDLSAIGEEVPPDLDRHGFHLGGIHPDDQRLQLEGRTEREYYAQQMTSAQPVELLGMIVAVIMAIGSSFAAMNTMYTAVARRTKEIGVLRMLGFSRGSILSSFLIESLLLSLLGGALGCLLVLPLNGFQGRIGNFVTFSETTFNFEVTATIMASGIAFAAIMGVLGGVLPARMAAKREILGAIRDA